jgi:ribonucleoside-diphosphate reductase alpha chain
VGLGKTIMTQCGFGEMLIKYLPNMRGITTYPDGARGGQPLSPVSYATARRHVGNDFTEEAVDICDLTKGGSCGTLQPI